MRRPQRAAQARSTWLQLHLPIAAVCLAGGLACSLGAAAPGRDLVDLTAALARGAGGGRVDSREIRWEPSRGAIYDMLFGRWVLFLATAQAEQTRDLWRACARVTPGGDVLDVSDFHDLTSTPLGDDHALVIEGSYAAFATRAYGQEQAVTVLALDGEKALNRTRGASDRAMAALTNLQRTGTLSGVGRVRVVLQRSARTIGLQLDPNALAITTLADGPHGLTRSVAHLTLATGEVDAEESEMHADAALHLPKRFSHWVVDTLRAVPWIGAAPIAWLEEQALGIRDTYRRLAFRGHADVDAIAAQNAASPPALDTSQSAVAEAHFPPPRIASMWKEPEPGEGEWVAPDIPWLRRVTAETSDSPGAFARTFVRPDPERPYARVV